MIFLFNWVIFRFHVNFEGCNNDFTHFYCGYIGLKSPCHFNKNSSEIPGWDTFQPYLQGGPKAIGFNLYGMGLV